MVFDFIFYCVTVKTLYSLMSSLSTAFSINLPISSLFPRLFFFSLLLLLVFLFLKWEGSGASMTFVVWISVSLHFDAAY